MAPYSFVTPMYEINAKANPLLTVLISRSRAGWVTSVAASTHSDRTYWFSAEIWY